jgi:hypothetical protein
MRKIGNDRPSSDQKSGADGVSGAPLSGKVEEIGGKDAAGESGGGAYPNPHSGKAPENGGFLGHGGQTLIDYHGSAAGASANAAAGAPDADDAAGTGGGTSLSVTHLVIGAQGQSFETVETNGVAVAERSVNPSEAHALRGNTGSLRPEAHDKLPFDDANRAKNREVENEMVNLPDRDGEPPKPATAGRA